MSPTYEPPLTGHPISSQSHHQSWIYSNYTTCSLKSVYIIKTTGTARTVRTACLLMSNDLDDNQSFVVAVSLSWLWDVIN